MLDGTLQVSFNAVFDSATIFNPVGALGGVVRGGAGLCSVVAMALFDAKLVPAAL